MVKNVLALAALGTAAAGLIVVIVALATDYWTAKDTVCNPVSISYNRIYFIQ